MRPDVSVRFQTRYFTTRTLLPFAIYCLVAGAIAIVRFAEATRDGSRRAGLGSPEPP